jgi:beta-lactamase superfamily II metal-dependent hydrolase
MAPSIYAFEVGHGDCHLIVADREAIVIDAGPANSSVIEFLSRYGYRVKSLILTHNDSDHSAGALRFLGELGEAGRIDFFWSLQDRTPNARVNRVIARAMELEKKKLIRMFRLEIDSEPKTIAQLGTKYILSLLHPAYTDNLNALGHGGRRPEGPNRTSAVLRLTDVSGQGVGLWSGDLPAKAWRELYSKSNCGAQWFVAPHHGSGNGWSNEAISAVLDAVDPAWMVLSVGTSNQYGHPSSVWMRAARARRTRIVCTQVTSQCHDAIDLLQGGVLARDHALHTKPPNGTACAGTVIYRIEDRSVLRSDVHQTRVSQLRTPMCRV